MANNTDFHNTGGGNNTAHKKMGVVPSSLNIVHQFLVFQLYIPDCEPFSLELSVRDKHNVSGAKHHLLDGVYK